MEDFGYKPKYLVSSLNGHTFSHKKCSIGKPKVKPSQKPPDNSADLDL
jgi:hypothetical protein